jgi:hypothetical protein
VKVSLESGPQLARTRTTTAANRKRSPRDLVNKRGRLSIEASEGKGTRAPRDVERLDLSDEAEQLGVLVRRIGDAGRPLPR